MHRKLSLSKAAILAIARNLILRSLQITSCTFTVLLVVTDVLERPGRSPSFAVDLQVTE